MKAAAPVAQVEDQRGCLFWDTQKRLCVLEAPRTVQVGQRVGATLWIARTQRWGLNRTMTFARWACEADLMPGERGALSTPYLTRPVRLARIHDGAPALPLARQLPLL